MILLTVDIELLGAWSSVIENIHDGIFDVGFIQVARGFGKEFSDFALGIDDVNVVFGSVKLSPNMHLRKKKRSTAFR